MVSLSNSLLSAPPFEHMVSLADIISGPEKVAGAPTITSMV